MFGCRSPAGAARHADADHTHNIFTHAYFHWTPIRRRRTQFRYATTYDIILIVLGVIFTFLKSLVTPLMIVVYGEFTTVLVDRTYGEGTSSATYLLPLMGGGRILYV